MILKKGIQVKVISGKDKGKTGEILEINRRLKKVKIKSINMIKRHTKPTKENKGGIISKESFIHQSNIKNIDLKKSEKKVLYDWTFVFSGLSFLLWLGLPNKGLHVSLYVLRVLLTWTAVVFILGSLLLKNHIRNYEKLNSQIYELEKKLERTPQKHD